MTWEDPFPGNSLALTAQDPPGGRWWVLPSHTQTETRRGSSKGEGGVMGKRRRHRIREEGATGRPTQIMNTVSKGVFHSPLGYFKSTNN